MTLPTIFLNGIGAFGPGFDDWPSLSAMLRGEVAWSSTATQAPTPQALPAAERRRVGMSVRLALAAGFEATAHAHADPVLLASVFSSSSGDGQICDGLCETLASNDRLISPTRFHNSVHNAASGYWSIATGCMAASTSLCAHDASFAAGMLEVATQIAVTDDDHLLIAYDTPYPEPMQSCRPLYDAAGIGLVFSKHPRAQSIAALQVSLAESSVTPCPIQAMTALQTGIPAARGLPLLSVIAKQEAGAVYVQYLDPLALRIEVKPCRANC
ncbi:MAG TPA: beta-ketoacyl synthase chain length factor [Rhodocyclaceae bacterium]|nr:beta-ketoacyl synthase chain length factor [Rhodocyclaceae bacterium]